VDSANQLEKLGITSFSSPGSAISYCFAGTPAIIVDPGFNFGEIADWLEKNKAEKTIVVLTHSHADHSAGVSDLAEKPGTRLKIFASENAGFSKNDTLENRFGLDLEGLRALEKAGAIGKLKDGDKIGNSEFSFTAILTPGHSPSCLALLDEKKKILASGDSLEGYRDDLPLSSPKDHEESIEKVRTMTDKQKFWRLAGHGIAHE